MARAQVLVLVVVVALAVAGCANGDPVNGASAAVKRASKVSEMLASPPGSQTVPTGVTREFTLYIHQMPQHEVYPGAAMTMWGFSLSEDPATATVPGPTLRVNEGDTVVVTLRPMFEGFNHTLHFHGQNVPAEMDGMPFGSQEPIGGGEEFVYTFIAKPSGTYWYHCHVDAQHHNDMGMYGVFIVDPADPAEDPPYDQDFVLVFDEMDRYHIEGGTPVAGNMPQNGDPFSYEEWLRRQGSDVVNRNTAVTDRNEGVTRPSRSDEYGYPVTHPPYTPTYQTFLINGYSFPYTEPLIVNDGETIRLRLVNAGNDMFTMHLHGHHVLVTHKDGVLLDSPYWSDVIAIAPGERYDVYVKLDNPGVWDLHDHMGGHTQNDYVFPGGAMTMLCYKSTGLCGDGGGHGHGPQRSGDLMGWSGRELP